ncbi:MAG: transketolase [Deltaproteobacteria bacterium]|nr:transketolase [Deltaproteobacteria bacterium]
MDTSKLDKSLVNKAVNTIKMLSVDQIEAAKSGHPGLPMGCSDMAFILFNEFIRFNPKDPNWANRDRFVLSAGHGSALIYSLLHLYGYDLSMDEVKNFRQWGSKTPGHPEYGHTPGVETTTGPLGQGFANGVGMAMAERVLANKFNKNGEVIDHFIYSIAGDGDMMEGISSEAASIAGHLGLSKLIYIYDSNQITIEGDTNFTFSEDVGKRFEAYNWQVLHVDGYDHKAMREAIISGQKEREKPTLIIAKTTIGKGSPNKANTASAHGEPLGGDETKLTKETIGWPVDQSFYVPDDVKELFEERIEELKGYYDTWQALFNKSVKDDQALSDLWHAHLNRTIPADIEEKLLAAIEKDSIATRAASGAMMQVIAKEVPALIGGSADLAPSTKTDIKGSPSIAKGDFTGKNIHFGIREHAMGAMMNGMAVYDGLIPYGSTFLVFSDYLRPSVRLSALMGLQAIYVFTHDSIFVGEDGPTHEPVEHVTSLRLIPNLQVIRPGDATETAAAWKAALDKKDGPTALILTRQNLPVLDRTKYTSQSNLARGAYILDDCDGEPDLTIMASGSEVALALEAAEELRNSSQKVRIVSVPSFELFDAQDDDYRKSITGNCNKIVAIEAGSTLGWYKYVGGDGLIIGIDRFGASAPAKEMAKNFGFNKEDVVRKIREKWKR